MNAVPLLLAARLAFAAAPTPADDGDFVRQAQAAQK